MGWPKGKPRNETAGAAAPVDTPAVPAVEREPTAAELREYDRRVARDLAAAFSDVAAKVRAVLVEAHGADIADRMMVDIMPVLKDPTREARRRPLRSVA
jgi:hypothetical protein